MARHLFSPLLSLLTTPVAHINLLLCLGKSQSESHMMRMLEDIDWQRTQHRGRLVKLHVEDATLQALLEPRRGSVRVPRKEMFRMLNHLERQHTEDRACQRPGEV